MPPALARQGVLLAQKRVPPSVMTAQQLPAMYTRRSSSTKAGSERLRWWDGSACQ